MKYDTAVILIAFFGLSQAAPIADKRSQLLPRYAIRGREVPQEHSHNKFLDSVRTSLNLNNPDQIQDPVFGLLGNAAAAVGQGKITDTDCLHQATADQAFTNAKAAGDVVGQTNALVFAALERNTGSVGLESVLCTAIKAVNPEIAALSQHQDPAATGAAAKNKAITLELARQIASIGGDPTVALQSGTFAPGTIGDPTGAGNTCDTVDDVEGCIFSQNLLVEDATIDEINAAVAGVTAGGNAAAGGKAAAGGNAAAAGSTCPAQVTSTVTVVAAAATQAAANCPVQVTSTITVNAAGATQAPATGNAATGATAGTNIQTFTGSLGGAAPAITKSAGDRPFTVNGNTFVNIGAAFQRSCDIQNNACFNAVNSGALSGGTAQCQQQQQACNAAGNAKRDNIPSLFQRQSAFGSCADPTILFADGLEGRDTAAFIPANLGDFNHGSAQKIGIIAQFICSQLESSCKAGADAVAACNAGEQAAAALTGQAAADAFNAAVTGGSAAAAAPAQAATDNANANANADASTAATGTNIQAFSGTLGGAAPAVIQGTGTKPFSVNGSTFVNQGGALQRSCSVQHNACADAANSGAISGGVQQCEDQEKACNAANA
ncbi:hypothetical protein VE04_00031 [Pseudogymnoascus sp. 24MN13]|nr:hypothetical protein VE04_00031 [Pseudogymnoascus sp. 24MN13]